MSRYTSATDADRQEMLAAIGVESIDDLFADVPEGVRLGRALDLPPGKPEQEVYARLRDLAAKNTSAEDEISFLGAGHVRPLRARADRLDPAALGVPDAVHALPARDQPGRAAGDVRVPDGDLRADRPAGLQRVRLRGPERGRRRRLARAHAHAARRSSSSPRACTRTRARRSRRRPRAGGRRSRRSRSTNGLTQLGEVGDDVAAIFVGQPNFYGAIEDLEALSAAQGRRAAGRPGRPADARRAAPARRVRRRHLRRRGPDARQPAGLRRAVASASSPPSRTTSAGCRAGSRARRPTSTAAAASCSRCRRASSTSAARRPRTTSARRRR